MSILEGLLSVLFVQEKKIEDHLNDSLKFHFIHFIMFVVS